MAICDICGSEMSERDDVCMYGHERPAADEIAALRARLEAVEKERVKRHEWKLPATNWLRDQINETLSRYDVHSDAYEKDVRIDALCVVAVDNIAALLDTPAPTQPAQVSVAEALKPFADAVYNDNGDVTIDTSHIQQHHWMKARAALRALSEGDRT